MRWFVKMETYAPVGACSRTDGGIDCPLPAVYVFRITDDDDVYGVCSEHAPEVYEHHNATVEWVRTYVPGEVLQ